MFWLKRKLKFNKLNFGKKLSFGKNSLGKITVRRRGGSNSPKAKIKRIDSYRIIWNMPAIVRTLERSFFHSAFLALIAYPSGILAYIIAPQGIKVGDVVEAGEKLPIKLGNNMLLVNIPLNVKIHNIEAFPLSGAKFVRSAGNWAKITEKKNSLAVVQFSNGKRRLFNLNCSATIGRVSNLNHNHNKVMYLAGQKRKKNQRPHVRGVAMNAVDHPHGGGKGKKSPKNPNYNFVRKLIKGRKTSKK